MKAHQGIRALTLALVLLVVIPQAGAQLTVCDGRNHQNNNFTGNFGLPAVRMLGVRFVPGTTLSVERLEFYYDVSILTTVSGGTVSILLEAAAAALPSTNPLDAIATTTWSGAAAPPVWDGGTFPAAVVLQANTPYWLVTTAAPITSHQAPANDAAGADATSYAIETNGTWFVSASPRRFKVRLLSSACSPGAASISVFGLGCAGSNGVLTLGTIGGVLPVLGNPAFGLEVSNAAPGAQTQWYIAAAGQANSIPLPFGCAVHLEPISLLANIAMGINPLFNLQADVTGFAQLPLPLPSDPALVGFTQAIQVLALDPGAPLAFTLTEALELTLGN